MVVDKIARSEETKKALSNKGRVYSERINALIKRNKDPEFRKKVSLGLMGHQGWNKGKTNCISEETRKKQSEASKIRWSNPEYRKKFSESMRGKVVSIETRKKMSESRKKWNKNRFKDIELEEEIKDIQKQLIIESEQYRKERDKEIKKKTYKYSVESRNKMSEKAKIRNANPEYKAKISACTKGRKASPELKKKLSLAHIGQKAWNKGKTGIYTEKHLERLREAAVNQVKEICKKTGGVFPNRGVKEIDCINELKSHCPYKIDDTGFYVTGYIVDGYIKELNLVIEFDETLNHTNPVSTVNDNIRQKRIENELNCTFFRIKEVEWDNDKKMVLESFRRVLLNLSGDSFENKIVSEVI